MKSLCKKFWYDVEYNNHTSSGIWYNIKNVINDEIYSSISRLWPKDDKIDTIYNIKNEIIKNSRIPTK